MPIHQDFEDLLRCLNAAKARYLLVGAHAVAIYTEPRYTKDMDIWVDPTLKNALKVYEALKRFGAPIENLGMGDLTNPKLFYQIGIAPIRIDIIMGVKGVDFSKAWLKKKVTRFGQEKIFVIGIEDLIKAKKASGRPQDKRDLAKLAKVKPTKKIFRRSTK